MVSRHGIFSMRCNLKGIRFSCLCMYAKTLPLSYQASRSWVISPTTFHLKLTLVTNFPGCRPQKLFQSYSSYRVSVGKIHLPCSKIYLPCIFVCLLTKKGKMRFLQASCIKWLLYVVLILEPSSLCNQVELS